MKVHPGPRGLFCTLWRSGSRWLAYAFREAYKDQKPKVASLHEPREKECHNNPGCIASGWTIPDRIVKPFLEQYPHMKVIWTVRHPVPYMRSCYRNFGHKKKGGPKGWANFYCNMHHRTQKLQKRYPDRIWGPFRIEDVWDDPEALSHFAVLFRLEPNARLRSWHSKKMGAATAEVKDSDIPSVTDDMWTLAFDLGYTRALPLPQKIDWKGLTNR